MTVRLSAKAMDSVSRLARLSDAHLQEATRIYVWMVDLESDLNDGRVALDFWNVRDSAAGWLESRCSLPSGASLWRLFSQTNKHLVALISREGSEILVLDICGRKGLEAAERRLCSSM